MWKAGENNTASPTLMALLDQLEMKGRDATAPVRILVLDRLGIDRATIAIEPSRTPSRDEGYVNAHTT